MFLTKENKIKWKLLGIAALVVVVLSLGLILWLDKPIYLLLRQMDCFAWGVLDFIFASKLWLCASLGLFVIIFAYNKLKKNARFAELRRAALAVFLSVASASVVVWVLKGVFGRMRPVFFEALGQTGFYPFNFSNWFFNSFPSGHTVASFAGLVMIGLLYPRVKPCTWALAVLIGVSRIMAGAHWPSDVLVGAFIGMVAADMVKQKLVISQ